MYFDFGPKSSILFLFFIHGIVFSILICNNGFKNGIKSNYWLASFVFLCAMYIAPFVLGYGGWYSRQPYRDVLFYTPFQQLFLMPPLLFFYIKSLLNPSYIFKKKDWLHFLPAILYLLYAIIIWVIDDFIVNDYYFYADNRDKDLDLWYQVSGFGLMVFYLFKCLQLYQEYKRNTYQTVSFADSILFDWIQKFLIIYLLLLMIRILFFFLNPEWANFGSKFWYYISFSILFYFLSISGYINSVKMGISLSNHYNFNQPLSDLLHSEDKRGSSIIGSEEDHTGAAVDENLKSRLENLMITEKTYKNPDLTLFDIAQSLGTHPKKVSNTVNKGFNMNFNDFVNSFRIQEVIQTFQSQNTITKTLLGIALDSGFNSKSTFNRAFKKQMKMTPKEYFKNNTQK